MDYMDTFELHLLYSVEDYYKKYYDTEKIDILEKIDSLLRVEVNEMLKSGFVPDGDVELKMNRIMNYYALGIEPIKYNSQNSKIAITKKYSELRTKFLFFLIIVVFGFLIFIIPNFILVSEKDIKTFTFVLTLIFIVSVTTLLFTQSFYKSFLGRIGYGGELPVVIEYRKADNTQSETKGLLLIRTKHNITLKNIVSKNIEEIPNDRISKIIFINHDNYSFVDLYKFDSLSNTKPSIQKINQKINE